MMFGKRKRPSDYAMVMFIADQTNATFWGSNEQEKRDIENIRRAMEEYIISPKSPPDELITRLAPIARSLLSSGEFDSIVRMYEKC